MNHLGGAYEHDANTFMPDVWGYLLVKYEVESVLDIGCGYGHALKWFSEQGLCRIRGIEGMPEYVEKSQVPGSVLLHDFTKGVAPIEKHFDLGWSAEFLEHVEPKYTRNYMEAFQLCKNIVVTHAEPGQDGHHHVNCQPDSYWIKTFYEYGFKLNASETELLRRTDRWKAGWGRRTLMSFTQQ